MSEVKKTELGQLGEFGLIHHLTDNIKLKHPTTIKGVGDDAAVLDFSDKKTVVTTDLLLEGIHFDLTYTPLKHLGYKAVVVNVSDVYAMNATPKQITVSLGLSSKMSVEALDELYEGIYAACDYYNVDLVGGDTSSSLTGLTISVTAMGEADANKLTYRNGAKPNDLICVSGDLGGAYMGLQLLEREKRVYSDNPGVQPDLSGFDYILGRQLKPEARKEVTELLQKLEVVPTAMIDISDGLSSELMHICSQSKTGCRVYENKIPVDPTTAMLAEEMGINPLVTALNGGEDYELLFTISQSDYEKFKDAGDVNIYIIGHITEESKGSYLVTNADQEVELQAQGWNPLKNKQ
ncbi:thiamine-phosphate kinase [Carboxylicivirga mesophila]|uniref:Thiamine-monophosphate kinase n=1 Tax=Carboxylicivirga mesophila TaxID=1166478 RepID=A0ABS5K5L0_9BACT|nr:thiamine-phosphate kinase [Carboxylicivirga mesophila]MBS2210255.1 thiamine-phosphate kinase [Carboxylicivirga mesophila]